jgi:hypothetical protein
MRLNCIQAMKWKFRAVKARFRDMISGDAVLALNDNAGETERALEAVIKELVNVIVEKVCAKQWLVVFTILI